MKRKQFYITAVITALIMSMGSFGNGVAATGTATNDASGGSTTTSLPPLPQKIKSKGKLEVGVKCDYPPFGYIDIAGNKAGYDVRVARQLATYAFGDPQALNLTCVTSGNRIPYLTSGKIDLIMATMTYLPSRAETVTFSPPTFKATGKLLVPKNSTVKTVQDLKGKTLITIQGADYAQFAKKCLPDVHLLTYNTVNKAMTALAHGRGQAFIEDNTLFIHLAGPNTNYKVVGNGIDSLPWGFGTSNSRPEFGKWIAAAVKKMQHEDLFWKFFKQAVSSSSQLENFKTNVPRPNVSFSYPDTKAALSAATGCGQIQ
jgi:polar amino acid transport system substrate-binding protein